MRSPSQAATIANPWRNRIVSHAEVAPAELNPNPANWRTHPSEQQRAHLTGPYVWGLSVSSWVGRQPDVADTKELR